VPIECPIEVPPCPNDRFKDIDRLVMGAAFDSQNFFGRLCDERVYENDVAARLRALDVDVYTQVPVRVSHEGFEKVYRLDLLAGGMVYEIKVAASFTKSHSAQVLNYAALLGIPRIKLLNFGTAQVNGRLVGCPFEIQDRHTITVDFSRWQALTSNCQVLLDRTRALLVTDIGGFLRAKLCEEALLWFGGGPDCCHQRLPVSRNGLEVGSHLWNLYQPECAFLVTTMPTASRDYERSLHRLLKALPVRGIQWINIHHTHLRIVTVA
jgi:GxxExxY protein